MTKKLNKNLRLAAVPDDDLDRIKAKALLAPSLQAGASAQEWLNIETPPDLASLTAELRDQADAIQSGDLSRAEEMLTAQAHTLDVIFNRLAVKAINAELMSHLDAYLKLALRAQSQVCRTWETVSAIKNPPIANYVRQANIAGGHQQVNNGDSRTRETEKAPTKLLEKTNGQQMDFGTESTASGANPAMETVGEVDRTEDASG